MKSDNLRLLMVVPSSRGFPIALGGNIPLLGYGYVMLIQSEIKQIQSCTSVFEKASQILVHPLVAECSPLGIPMESLGCLSGFVLLGGPWTLSFVSRAQQDCLSSPHLRLSATTFRSLHSYCLWISKCLKCSLLNFPFLWACGSWSPHCIDSSSMS